jgi:hypothetical protein
MRAVTSDIDSLNPAESFLRVMDQFASLSSFASDASAVGGYRVLSSQRPVLKKKTHRTLAHGPVVARGPVVTRARLRWTGSLSVLFVGSLGLAVLAGPANCPCSSVFAVAEQSSLLRLGYVQNARMMTEREFGAQDAELPELSTAALVEPEQSAVGVSPITTSALVSSHETAAVQSDDLPATTAGSLPLKIEQVADAAPQPVRLAVAATIESDVPPTLPAIDVTTPATNDVAASDPEGEPVAKSHSAKKRITRAYRTPLTLRAKAKKPLGEPVRSPKWAAQMFTNPWQSQAFSYTR